MRLGTTIFAAALASALFAGGAQAQDTVKIGWALPKSGPGAPGAAITTLPNYQVWVKDVNDAGGLNVGGKKMKIEVIEYDDRSNSEELIKAVERLATQDKVDRLAKLTGAEFDRAFSRAMIAGHEKAVEKFEMEIKSGQDPDVKVWAEKRVTTLKEHLEHARTLLTAAK